MTPEEFEDMLVRHEGMELKPYECTAGKLTIGVGRNIEDNGITEDEAMYLLRNDIKNAARELGSHYPVVRDLDSTRYYVLVNMAFNLGIHRLSKFKKMWANITIGNYEGAADEMLDSKWAVQVGYRADELAELMERGDGFYKT